MQKNTLPLFLLLFVQVATHAMTPGQWILGSNWIGSVSSNANSFESDATSHFPSDTVSFPAGTPQDQHSLLLPRDSKSCSAQFPENFLSYDYCFGPMEHPEQEPSFSPDDTPVISVPKSIKPKLNQPVFMPEPQKTQAPQPRKLEDLYPAYLLGKKTRQKQTPPEPSHKEPLKSIGNITEEMLPAEKDRLNHNSSLAGQTNNRQTTSIGSIVMMLMAQASTHKKLKSNDQLNMASTDQSLAAPATKAQNRQESEPIVVSQTETLPIAIRRNAGTAISKEACHKDFSGSENADDESYISGETKKSSSTESLIFELDL